MRYYICFLFCLFLWLLPSLVPAGENADQEEITIDFLYINANCGEAAGGHTALRLGESVFHYQFFSDSTFLLVREPWDSFRFLYNDLHNRSIAIASLPLDSSVATRIRNHFTELLISQQQFFDNVEKLEKEIRVTQKIAAGDSEISVKCLGFFDKSKTDNQLVTVRDRIAIKLGPDFLQKQLAESKTALRFAARDMEQGKRVGERLQELVDWREAIRVLVQGLALSNHALIRPMEEERELGVSEIAYLENFSEYLIVSIVDLLQSSRPNRGETLLLQTARYLAVRHSLMAGRIFSLDPFTEKLRVVQLTDEDIAGGRLKNIQKDLQRQSAGRRDLFFHEKQHPEIAFSLLETDRARAWELSQVDDSRRAVRLLTKITLPSRPGVVSLNLFEAKGKKLQTTAERLQRELKELQKKSLELYGYNLFSRNCATELIRSLNTSFKDKESGKRTLGGWLEADSGLVFIPFLFYDQSITAFPIKDEQLLPARRLRMLESSYEQENDLLVWLRESNTLSATLYKPNKSDTPFLFFTDDSLLLRPVQGIMNVAYGVLHGVGGIVSLPFDGGEQLNRAARGIFYSLPELVFGNIRKGSYSGMDLETDQTF
ncbi:MAG TPA: hypothetical protein EYG88_03270 [Desulfocapsa sulfexigens]|nr:hypothetical protein [Desulfocapsa sulfexigens]